VAVKTIEEHFHDWESHVFGFGYGTGEEHTLPVLKKFLSLIQDRGYNYQDLEAALTAPVAWLLINILCRADILEYGCSPRFAWLTQQGKALKQFVDGRTDEDLYELTDSYDDYHECYPHHCNCNDGPCVNPFWGKR
jgi:hypothetical protein